MSWSDFYKRRDTIDAVLREAERDPHGPLPFADIDGAAETFSTQADLLLALHYQWMQLLTGHLRAALTGQDDTSPHRHEPDQTEQAADAWERAARAHPTLRAVLDANIDRYPEAGIPALHREQRVLAVTAGLAEPGEPVEEITRVGATFLALIRHGSSLGTANTIGPPGRLLRLASGA